MAMAMAFPRLFFPLFLFFSFFLISPSLSIAPNSQAFQNAVEILYDSGFLSMALTLELTFQTLVPLSSQSSASFTIFCPSDVAFGSEGQPSLKLLQFHFSPLRIPPESLLSLPVGARIPTLFPNHSLIVTSTASGGQIFLNEVPVNVSALFNDPSLVIYPIDRFFDTSFRLISTLPSSASPVLSQSPPCMPSGLNSGGFSSFREASDHLKTEGYSTLAALLEAQLMGLQDSSKMTIFAPTDYGLKLDQRDFGQFLPMVRRHVLPCRLEWVDLLEKEDGTELQTLSQGFVIYLNKNEDGLVLNGSPVVSPNLYVGDRLVVHGIGQVMGTVEAAQDGTFQGEDSNSGGDYIEFGGR